MRTHRASLAVLLGALGCGDRPPPSAPAPATPVARSESASGEREAAPPEAPGVFDVPGGGCAVAERDSPRVCTSARELPLTLSFVPTKLHGLAPLAGGQVKNRSSREVYAIGSSPDRWEIARVAPGATLGGELAGDARHTTTDVDWVSAIPPTPDASGAFRYEPSTLGVKISDGSTLDVVDRPGGVRFELGPRGPLGAEITTAGRMNGGSVIVFTPKR